MECFVTNKVVKRLPVNRLPVKLPVTGFIFKLPITDLPTYRRLKLHLYSIHTLTQANKDTY